MYISLSLALLLSSTSSIVNAEVRPNVKAIPKAFIGEWVGLNWDKQRPAIRVFLKTYVTVHTMKTMHT